MQCNTEFKIHQLLFFLCTFSSIISTDSSMAGVCMLVSHVQLFATPWTVAHQAPLSMEFSRQEYWSGLPFLSPGDLPNPGIELGSPAFQADSLPPNHQGRPSMAGNFEGIVAFGRLSKMRYLRHVI